MRSSCVLAALALMTSTACGARADLDVPPRPPCALDRTLAPIETCEEWTLGPAQTIDVDRVWALRATWHPDGVAVAYSVLSAAEARHEVRTLVLDMTGSPLGAPVVVTSVAHLGFWLNHEPSVVGGCELGVLGQIVTILTGPSHESRIESEAALGIVDRDGAARTIEVPLTAGELVWDLRGGDDEELTWLVSRVVGEESRVELVHASRDGTEVARSDLGVTGAAIGAARLGLDGGGFAMVGRATDPARTHAFVFSETGAPVGATWLSDGASVHAGEVERDDARWIAWSERPSSSAIFDEPDAMHLARLRADGTVAERMSFALDDVRPASTWEIAWRGGSFLVPVIDDERGYVGIFDAAGRRTAVLDFGARFEGAEIIATDRGALVVASERTDPVSSTDTRLVARSLTCVR